MGIKVCSKCQMYPVLENDELGMKYWYECPECGEKTIKGTSRTSTVRRPRIDEEAKDKLSDEWNSKN